MILFSNMEVFNRQGNDTETIKTDMNNIYHIQSYDMSWFKLASNMAYIQPNSFKYSSQKQYKKMERDSLLAQLDCTIDQKRMKAERIKDIITNLTCCAR